MTTNDSDEQIRLGRTISYLDQQNRGDLKLILMMKYGDLFAKVICDRYFKDYRHMKGMK